jgi:hypothetical protein
MRREVFFLQGQLLFTDECRSFPPDDLPLLTARLRLPQWEGTGGRPFNRYYAAYGRAFFSYCQSVLLPQAQEALAAARENGGALPEWQIGLDTVVTLHTDGLLSLYTDTVERCSARRMVLRRSETWDLTDASLVPLSRFFPEGRRWRRHLLSAAAAQIRLQQQQGVALYHPDWQRRLRTAFNSDRFYLTEQGLFLFYQMYAIAPAAEGIPAFFLPWNEDGGPVLPE